MFALRFGFPAGRYHATPWGRNVNEADVAWPPEPWRLIRALIAAYWRKGDRERWSEDILCRLIDALADTPPVYRLPEGAIHAHTRHYMPQARGGTTLVFDGFVRLPDLAKITAAWPDLTLDAGLFNLANDLARAIGYLGRAESWTEGEALADWHDKPNCGPLDAGFEGDPVRTLAPLSHEAYTTERNRLIAEERTRLASAAEMPLTGKRLETQIDRAFRNSASGVDTLPERLIDAIALDTADHQAKGWSRPPAAREIIYAREEAVALGVVPAVVRRHRWRGVRSDPPTVARYLLAGRPRPRIEDAVKIGELMRLAALSRFGWARDETSGRRIPNAPPVISGRGGDGKPLRDPSHSHAFWLPEDADSDGLIDHISVVIPHGIGHDIRVKLDRITRLWLEPRRPVDDGEDHSSGSQEWRLALEGFGKPEDFAGSGYIFGRSARWRSATPFLAAGRLKSDRYAREFRRLVNRTGLDARFLFDVQEVKVSESSEIDIGGIRRRVLHFHRFRSRGGERQHDTAGVFLDVEFPVAVDGPLALGFGCHFGLGLFALVDEHGAIEGGLA